MTVPENHIPLLMYTLFPKTITLSRRGRGAGANCARGPPRPLYTNRYSLRYHHLSRGSDSRILAEPAFPECARGAIDMDNAGRGRCGDGSDHVEVEVEG